MVRGSAKTALSFQRDSLRREGFPAKRSRMPPVITCCGWERVTPGAVGKEVVWILYCSMVGLEDIVGDERKVRVEVDVEFMTAVVLLEAEVIARGNVSKIVGGIDVLRACI